MNRVKVIYIGLIQQSTGVHDEEVNLPSGSTVRDLLSSLVQRHGEAFSSRVVDADGELHRAVRILVNDRGIDELDGLDTKLEDEAETCLMVVGILLPGG